MIKKICLATSNKGKIAEFNYLLKNKNIEFVLQSDLDIDDVEETGLTYIENAILKARHASLISGLPTIADDSGLSVEALNGATGIYSARYSSDIKVQNQDHNNNIKLLKELEFEGNNRSATYHCFIVYLKTFDDPTPLIFHGKIDGIIAFEEKGQYGFAYDSLFISTEKNKRLSEMTNEEKNDISHRGIACKKLMEFINNL